MIGISSMPPCGLGNRIIYYYNLRQQAHYKGVEYFCSPWPGHELFSGPILGNYPPKESYEEAKLVLGSGFFQDSGITTREVFQLKDKPQIPDHTCGIHIRGGDYVSHYKRVGDDGYFLPPVEYYINSVESTKAEVESYVLFTDDVSWVNEEYSKLLKYFKDSDLKLLTGQNSLDRSMYANDFMIMSECDYLISAPSTYSVCSGFIGREKKIIHSRRFLEWKNEEGDKFWADLYAGGNEDYKLWRMI